MATARMQATLRWPRITELLLTLVLLVTLVPASAAQEPLRAVLKAQPVEGWVLEPAPSSLSFTPDSELNARLRPLTERLLAQRGYAIGGATLLRILIETDLQTRRPRRRVGLSAGAGDSSFGQVVVQIKSPFKKADRRAPITSYRVYVEVRGTNKLGIIPPTQENADPDVLVDLEVFFQRLVPEAHGLVLHMMGE